MIRRFGGFSNWLPTTALAAAFLLAAEMPLLATPQSGQANRTTQPDNDGKVLPDTPQPQLTQSPQQSPTGAAGAKAANPKGAPAAQPVGAAVAPVRQKGHHSLIVKLGLIMGAAAAIGTVVALSERSPSRPPGTSASSNP